MGLERQNRAHAAAAPHSRHRQRVVVRARAFFAGAAVEFQRSFTPRGVWTRLRDDAQPPVTIFMGVPTMYVMLMRTLQGNMSRDVTVARRVVSARSATHAVSGSAACPVPILEEWRRLTGRSLLERYGMTEIGMALSNPYDESKHKPGFVGVPSGRSSETRFRSVGDEDTGTSPSDEYARGPGELLVKGDNLFAEYFDNEKATAESFDADGFFKTRDEVAMTEDGFWRILRKSVGGRSQGGRF